jgi:hypothetical protein
VDLVAKAKAEVVNRHHFFVEWFTGCASESAMEISRQAFAPDMIMIGPDGGMIGADEVKAMIEGARGKRSAGFEIRVDVIAARQIGQDVVLVIYDEHQVSGGEKSVRRSSALFSPDADAPEGVVWRQLQETWITSD